jgi:hypothetical protein
MTVTRGIVGLLARAVFWLCIGDIVVNAVSQAISAHQYVLAFFELGFFPATYLLYPFLQPDTGNAWPWAEGHTLIPILIVGVLAYPISTLIGGLEPIE